MTDKPVKAQPRMLDIPVEDDDIREQVGRILRNRSIADERKVLEVITDAITAKYTDPQMLEQAVKQTLYKYENKLRVFAIAAAQRQLGRIMRLIDTLDSLEAELGSPHRFAGMDNQDLIRLYTVTQANLNNSLDYVKKVIDFKIELAQAQSSLMTAQQKEEIDAMSGIPSLNPQQRDRVRKIVQGMADEIIQLEDGDTDISLPEVQTKK